MNKDRLIGAAIVLFCLLIAVFYLATLAYPSWLSNIGIQSTATLIQFWIIAVPVTIAFIGILGIGAWIGWTMATTPPPKPIDEVATEKIEETTGNK